MTWRDIDMLWLQLGVVVVALLLVWNWYRRRSLRRSFAPPKRLSELVEGRSGVLRTVRGTVLVLALGLVTLALAGPQFGNRTRTVRKRGVDVVVALDFSKSMLARDVKPSRIDRAKAELTRLFETSTGDRIGLVAFAGDTLEFPLTYDYGALGLFLRDLGPGDMPFGGTAIGRALVSAGRLLSRSQTQLEAADESKASQKRSQVVILMTDGEDHQGDPVAAARELAQAGIKVFVVGIGSRSGEPIPTYANDGTWTGYLRDESDKVVTTSLTAANEQTLREVAEVTEGGYFRAKRGTVGVDAVARALRRLKQTETKTRQVTVQEDRYALPLLLGFLLLLFEALLPEAWRGRQRRVGSTLVVVLLAVMSAQFFLAPSALAWDWFESRNSDVEAGNKRLQANKPKTALEAYNKAARSLPDAPGVHLNRGLALMQQKKWSEARDALLMAGQPPANADMRARGYYNLGLTYLREGDEVAKAAGDEPNADAKKLYQQAADAFRDSIGNRPGDRDAAWNLELALRRIAEQQQLEEQQKQNEQDQNPDAENKQQDKDSDPSEDQQGSDDSGSDKQDEDTEADQNPQQDPSAQSNQDQNQKQPGEQGSSSESPQQSPQQAPQPQGGDDPGSPKQQEATPNGNDDASQGRESGDEDGASEQQPSPLPADAARILDALEQNEKSYQGHRARQRGGSRRRPPKKDW